MFLSNVLEENRENVFFPSFFLQKHSPVLRRMCEGLGHFYLNVCFPDDKAASCALERRQEIERSSVCVLLLKSTVTRCNDQSSQPASRLFVHHFLWFFIIIIILPGRSSVVEDCDEAFVKNPDGRPLVLYLRTEEGHSLSTATRQLLERVNAADKAAKIKVDKVSRIRLNSSCYHTWKNEWFIFVTVQSKAILCNQLSKLKWEPCKTNGNILDTHSKNIATLRLKCVGKNASLPKIAGILCVKTFHPDFLFLIGRRLKLRRRSWITAALRIKEPS